MRQLINRSVQNRDFESSKHSFNLYNTHYGPNLTNCNQTESKPLNFRPVYRKIPKISPGAYIFQRVFLRGLFLELLMFGGANNNNNNNNI